MKTSGYTSDFNRMINITILNGLGFFFLDFLIPYVANLELNASGSQMGIIFSIRTVGYLSIAPLVGTLADKISSKLLIIIGSFGRGLSYFLFYFSIIQNSLILMIIGNLLLGLMVGFFWIPLDVLISSKSTSNHRSEAFGKRQAAVGKGTVIGSIIGFTMLGVFAESMPENKMMIYSPLVIYGLGNILAGYLFFNIDEKLVIDAPTKTEDTTSYLGFIRSLPRPFLVALLLVMATLFLANTNASIAKPFIIVFLTSNLVQDPTIASVVYIPAGIISMLIAPKLGKLIDRFNMKIVIAVGVSIGALTTVALVSTQSLVIFSLLLIVDVTVGMATGLVVQNLLSRLSAENRGKIFGLQTVFSDIGAIFGPVVGGMLWDIYGQKSPFYFSVGVEFLLIPIMIYAIIRIEPFLDKKIVLKTADLISSERTGSE